jgi:hypothetical protein
VLEGAAPVQALLPIISSACIKRHIYLHHSGFRFEAQFGGWRTRCIVGSVWVLEDKKAAAEREGRVKEDLVGGGDRVVVLVLKVDLRRWRISHGFGVCGRHVESLEEGKLW